VCGGLSTCVAFVTLCSIPSISSRQTIVTGTPRDARVPLLACVLGVHASHTNSHGKQEPPDLHGQTMESELKEGSKNLCHWARGRTQSDWGGVVRAGS
jgi:hypothetical protein